MPSQKSKFVKLWDGLGCLELKNKKKNAHLPKISTTVSASAN